MDEQIMERAKPWLEAPFDEETRTAVRRMIESNPQELADSFYRDLEFGTGGLRGIMGAGTNRMNKYTVGMATQGLANYLKQLFPGKQPIGVAVAFDSRNNSPYFARITAEVFAANGFLVYLFSELRPTPELSFTIRHYGCRSGVMITASHNPKEYSGYKAYWDDGAQMIEPHDRNMISEVQKITSVDQVLWHGNPENIRIIGAETDEAYYQEVLALSLSPEAIRQHHGLKIVYTPLHGTGRSLVPEVLKRYGFTDVGLVEEQMVPDGNFPTVRSPNPEEHEALTLAIRKAEETGADLVMATDPDADRVGIAVRDPKGKMILLNGNQTASILFYYILNRWKEMNRITGKEFIVKTIVTSELLRDIARSFSVESFDVLTGFKFIADIIRRNEGQKKFIVGGEESYGYLTGDFVRDKDAVSSCAMIAEAAAWTAGRGKSLFDLLLDIYRQYAFYKETLISITKKGMSGAEEIRQLMAGYRTAPPPEIHDRRVVTVIDYLAQTSTDLVNGISSPVGLPKSDVLQFILEDGSKISVRPSGTEPKIKFYFGVKEHLDSREDFDKVNALLDEKIDGIIRSMNLK